MPVRALRLNSQAVKVVPWVVAVLKTMNAREGIKTVTTHLHSNLLALKTMNAREGIKTNCHSVSRGSVLESLKTMNAREGIKTLHSDCGCSSGLR